MFGDYQKQLQKISLYDYTKTSRQTDNTIKVLDFVDYSKIYGIPVIQHDKYLVAF